MTGHGIDDLLYPVVCIDGCNVVWSDAVDAYVHNPAVVGYPVVETGRTVCVDCGCGEEFGSPCNGDVFTNPLDDEMPWAVPGRPETYEFLGVRVKPGTELALAGSIVQSGGDDWTTGVLSAGKATLTGTFQIVGLSSRAVRYGYNWFARSVQFGPGCGTAASVLSVWTFCQSDDPVEWASGGHVVWDDDDAPVVWDVGASGRRYLRQARVIEFAVADDNPFLSACKGVEVNVTWEIEDSRLWLDSEVLVDTLGTAWPIDLSDPATADGCSVMARCDPSLLGMVQVPVSHARETRPVSLSQGGTWCPVGQFNLSDLQLFGGADVAVPEVFSAQTLAERVACDACAVFGIRLIWDQSVEPAQFRFLTVRWVNPQWQLQTTAGIPCECPLEVVETLHIHYNDADPPVLARDLAQYTGTLTAGSECCPIRLVWGSGSDGFFYQVAGPSVAGAPRVAWNANDPAQYADINPGQSGWPPAGCVITIDRPECAAVPPVEGDLAACVGARLPVRLMTDGTWDPMGWTVDQSEGSVWPPAGSEVFIAEQVDTPVTDYVWVRSDDLACTPGGAGSMLAPPLEDPFLDDVVGLPEWCEPSVKAAYPWVVSGRGCERLSTLVVTVGAGVAPVQFMRWAVWPRVEVYGDMDTAESRAHYSTFDPVAVGEVPVLGPGQSVTFNGQTGGIEFDCGQGSIGENELAGFGPSGVFTPPTLLGGADYLFVMLPHPWATPLDAWYRVEIAEWEEA